MATEGGGEGGGGGGAKPVCFDRLFPEEQRLVETCRETGLERETLPLCSLLLASSSYHVREGEQERERGGGGGRGMIKPLIMHSLSKLCVHTTKSLVLVC